MGMLQKIWKKIKGGDAVDQFFAPLPPRSPFDNQPLTPDECYVELYVNSIRLEKARRFATRFHGLVYTFATLVREIDKNEIAAVSKPDKLADLDKNSIGNVITVDKKMMGPVAWRGGTLSLEVGLFSAKSGNLLSPVLDFVTRVSETAGISYVGAVKPFLPLITEGMDMIAGQKDDTNLEVGLDTDLTLTTSTTYALVDAPKESIARDRLSIDPNDGKLMLDGQPFKKGYCVFSIRRVDRKADYGQIPSIKEKTEALYAAIRTNVQKNAEDAFTALRLEILTSPDLITRDKEVLIKKAREKVRIAFEGGGVSVAKRNKLEKVENPLEDLQLYG